MKHFLSLLDWTADELRGTLELAARMKASPAEYATALAGRSLAMIFEKPSTRTRVSFELGMAQLGGTAMFLSANDLQLGRGETIPDTARVLARYADCIMARVFEHDALHELTVGGAPVINGLSDHLHPCQALADVMTVIERKGRADGVALAYVGDGDNVCHSLINASARFGLDLRIGCPATLSPHPDVLERAHAEGAQVHVHHDPRDAVAGADVVYTDVWTSMGHESEGAKRRRIFAPYRVDEALFSLAASDAIFMHCLPAHRGEEVTDAVLDHERSAVLDQAENRMHAQKALLFNILREGA